MSGDKEMRRIESQQNNSLKEKAGAKHTEEDMRV